MSEGDVMNNNMTKWVFILDKSGSMAGLELDTIKGDGKGSPRMNKKWVYRLLYRT